MRIEVAWAKVPKGGFGESGDSIELVERPLGGITLILADGQGSGPAARRISRMVAMKAVSLVADGSRDGAVARAVQDMLYTAREGRVTATLALLSADLDTRTVVISRNTPMPVVVCQEGQVFRVDGASDIIGTYRRTRPAVSELPLVPGTVLLTYSDGVANAGRRYGKSLAWDEWDKRLAEVLPEDLGQFVDQVLQEVLDLDQGRPADDVSLMAMGVKQDDGTAIRRLRASIP
ncbi:MAG: PP2C family protein-serine/threonine phosphatase [Thermaerobacter sp.]|nr:PP2C family protein-serine/threonine phosphatase [Thermaerobacter sp.]